jgi:acyl-CoA reductase-like NAD-dependent aldehyde dehydrogenase
MSNRLEREFPAHRWQAVPPIRRDPVLHDVAEHYRARGRELRSAAFRRATHAVVATVGRALAQVVAFVRCAAYGIAKQAPEHDCRGASARGA